MRLPANIKAALPFVVWHAFFMVAPAEAAIDSAGVMDGVLERYLAAVTSWADVITAAASWLFWTLVLISMVWTFGMMALRKADIGDFFAEFVRFTIFVGFFWWLLLNGPSFASSIFESLRQLAGNATGLGSGLSPSGIVDVGFAIFDKVLDQSALWSPVDTVTGVAIAGIILVLLALVSIKMLLLLIAGWVLAFAGIFFLGFGGSRWTSDFAINYFKTVLALAVQLMTMVLLVGIGKTFLDDYFLRMSTGVTLNEMAVMLIVAVILFMLVSRIPPLLAGIVTGARVGGVSIGALGSGAAPAPAGMAMTAVTAGGAAVAAGTANAAGGVQALMATFSGANQNVAVGSDLRYGLGDPLGRDGSSGGAIAGASHTPFAAAAGFSGGTPAGQTIDVSKNSDSASWAVSAERGSSGNQGDGSAASRGWQSATGAPKAGMAGQGRQQQGQGGQSSGIATSADKAGLVAADAGVGTSGGEIASSFQGQGEAAASGGAVQSLSLADKGLGGASGGGGWMNQTGGFSGLLADDQEKARRSYAEWQSRNSDQTTLGVEEYVSHFQKRQQERRDEVADFIKRT